MKILCVIDSLGSGGAQRQLVELAIGFKEKGHDVSFLVYHNKDFFKNLLDEAEIPVNIVIESNYFKRFLRMRKYIRKGNYNAVLSFLEAPNFICEIAGLPWRKWKLVVGERSSNPNILKSIKLKFYRWLHLLADYVVANSYRNVALLKRINPILKRGNVKVIYNIVNFNKWKPSTAYIPRKNGKFSLLIMANHQDLKNAKGLIQAVNILPQTYKDSLIIHWYGRKDSVEVIDTFKEAKKLVSEFNLQNQILFYDPQLNMSELIYHYDAVGLFSYYEGLSNSICEGMASGKPIITTNVSDNMAIIDQSGSGFVIDGFDSISIKNSLRELMDCPDDKLIKMGLNACKKSFFLFKKEHIVSNYLNLFQ